jgi:predicted alpha/beta superfamily hydrolase
MKPLSRRLLAFTGLGLVAGLGLLAAWRLQSWRAQQEERRLRATHTLSGNVRARDDFRSRQGGPRRVWVYLPPQYDREPERRFPVLYMHDGQNVFDGATAFIAGKEWRVDETAERLTWEGPVAPLIVVALDNAGARRADEYTPVRDDEARAGGEADAYGRLLIEELKPWIDQAYRTLPGREATGISGSSLGGLVSLYLGLRHPEVFSRVASLSTSVWWGQRFLLGFVTRLPAKTDTRIWTDIGTGEGERALRDARELCDALRNKGWRDGVDLRCVEAAGARHDETAWATRVPDVLTFLFPADPLPRRAASR